MTSHLRASVIIPAFNAAHYLERSLAALYSSLPGNTEVIVVNDGSSDNTSFVAANFGALVIDKPSRSGPSAARNAGACKSKADILVFLDADVEVHNDTIQLLCDSLESNPEYAAVFGSYDSDPADRHLVSYYKNLMHHHVHQTGHYEAQTFWTGCGAIRRSVFQTVGFFRDVSLACAEDIDYGHRLRDAGYHIWLRPLIECKHLKRWTLGNLVKTDVINRGIPWTVMMLRRGKTDNDLNLSLGHRISAIMALAVVLSSIALPFVGLVSLVPAMACLICLLILQRRFFKILYSRRGLAFAVASIPLHILYYCYSLIAFAAGLAVYIFSRSKVATLPPH